MKSMEEDGAVYVVVVSNANHVRMMGPGAEVLHARGEDVRILTTDAWYGQGSAAAAARLSCAAESLPAPPGRGADDWFATPWDRRLLATDAAAPRVRSIVESLGPRAVLLGNDTGLLEQLVISAARDLGVPTILMQDADFVASQARTRPTGQLLLGEGGCDAALAWGPRGAEYYRALGLSIPIHHVGSPKISNTLPAAEEGLIRDEYELGDASVILVPLQCCARYGMLSEEGERTHFLDIVDAVSAVSEHRVIVTPHPSHTPAEGGWYRAACAARPTVAWVDDRPSTDLLPAADVVVGIDSAFLLDAVALGVPAVAATFGVRWAKTEYESAIPVFETREGFRQYTADRRWIDAVRGSFEERRHRFVHRLLSARDTEAAHRVADAMITVADDAACCATDSPRITSVLRVTDDGLSGLPATLRAIRGQRGVANELRVIDATEHGISDEGLPPGTSVIRDRDPSLGRALRRATSDVESFIALWEPGVTALPHRLLSAHRTLSANPQVDVTTSDMLCRLPSGPILARQVIEDGGRTLPPGWRGGVVFRPGAVAGISDTAFWPTDRRLIDDLIDGDRWMHSAEACAILDDDTARARRPSSRWEDGLRVRRPAPEDTEVDLSVIICTFNRPTVTLACLESFARQSAATDSYEIILVDDSTDPTLSDLCSDLEWPVRTRVIRRERGSLASARNAAIAVANGRYLLFVNDDTIAFPDCVREHVRAHRLAPDDVSVLGTFEQPPEALDGALMRYLEQSTEVFCYALIKSGQRYDWTRYWTCNVSSPAKIVRAVGAFDESFENYGCEDTDLGYRLQQAGLPVLYNGAARAHHRHILSFDDLERRQKTVARAWVRLIKKHPEMLEHADWSWVQGVTRASARDHVTSHAAVVPTWERAARTLAASDVGGLLPLGDVGAAVAREELGALGELIRRLNELWWQDGFAQGLEENGLEDFASLLDSLPGPLDAHPRPHVVMEIDDEVTSSHLPALRAALDHADGGTIGLCIEEDRFDSAATHLVAAAAGRTLPALVRIDPPPNQTARRRLLRRVDAFVPDAMIQGESHLVDARAAGVRIIQEQPAHLLASRAPMRVLVHPDWRSQAAIEDLLREFGPALADREDVCLALLLDPNTDPPLDDVLPDFAAAHAATMGAATTLNALVIDDVASASERIALTRAVHATLPSPGASSALATTCRSGKELDRLIAAWDAAASRPLVAGLDAVV